jgi:hypothetical protein
MSDTAFDAFTRRADALASRRASLLHLGGAALAAGLLGPTVAGAKKGGKKGKQKCKKQVDKCRTGVTDLCAALFTEDFHFLTPVECASAFKPCCERLAGCNAAAAFQCAVDVYDSFPEP